MSGFWKNKICQTTFPHITEELNSAIDNGNIIGAIAIDLNEAFDHLPHGLLIAKLAAYVIDLSTPEIQAQHNHK